MSFHGYNYFGELNIHMSKYHIISSLISTYGENPNCIKQVHGVPLIGVICIIISVE